MPDTSYTFVHRGDGRSLTVVGTGPFPLIDATQKLADETGYPDDWEVMPGITYDDPSVDTGERTPTVTVKYGPDGRYLVEFALTATGKLVGRYLGPKGPSSWTERSMRQETRQGDETARNMLLLSIRRILVTYGD